MPAVLPPDKNAIFLFGMFTILDNAGRDITYMLSPKLRTIFLYILLNSVGKRGVLSSDMNQIFWPDKSGSNVKNLKGVSMNHVRKILQDVDGIELVYRNGYFCMVFGEEFYCELHSSDEPYLSGEKEERDSRCHTCGMVGNTFCGVSSYLPPNPTSSITINRKWKR